MNRTPQNESVVYEQDAYSLLFDSIKDRYLQSISNPKCIVQIKDLVIHQETIVIVGWNARRRRYLAIIPKTLKNYAVISNEQAEHLLRLDSSKLEKAVLKKIGGGK